VLFTFLLSVLWVSISYSQQQLSWKFSTGAAIHSSPVISGEVIYFGSADSSFYALNKKSGKLSWKFKTKGQIIVHATPVIKETVSRLTSSWFVASPPFLRRNLGKQVLLPNKRRRKGGLSNTHPKARYNRSSKQTTTPVCSLLCNLQRKTPVLCGKASEIWALFAHLISLALK